MEIDISYDTADFDAQVSIYIDTTIRPAIAAGLTAAADKVRIDLMDDLEFALDEPTGFTYVHGIKAWPAAAKKGGGDIASLVFVQPQQAKYLQYQIDGGVRRAGDYATMPTGVLSPGPDAELDVHGNMPRDWLHQTSREPYTWWTKLRQGRGHTALVRRRPGEELQYLAFILPEVEYDARWDFYGLAIKFASEHVTVEVSTALAIATAKADTDQ